MEFDYIQEQAMNRMKSGSILVGGTGSGKSRTALAYFFVKECNGRIDINNGKADVHLLKDIPKQLYIITTAAKRDKGEWEKELVPFGLTAHIDSWNNIKKYVNVNKSFFIFDEQRVVGSGAWSKSFIKISKSNNWILLSATPGDQWKDYIPVFIANGYYKNRTEFYDRHVVLKKCRDYWDIDYYVHEDRLEAIRNKILIEMEVSRKTIPHKILEYVDYDKENYILIYGQKVKISTKNLKSESYYTILEYTVQKNPNNNYSVIFPKTYRGPKNRLINPLCNTLKKGQKVSFAIKSFSIVKMVVLDGDRKHRLKRKNNIFSGNVIIKSNKKNSSVKIGYSEDGKTFGVLYEYDVVT